MTNVNARAFAVDGTGRIIRPGNQVRIKARRLTDVADRGRVVELENFDVALLDVGRAEPVPYFISRLSLHDGGHDEPAWVY